MIQGAMMWPTGNLSDRESEIVEVYCSECLADIGTMDMLQLSSAIASKGRVLCPACRSKACVHCGDVGKRNVYGLCWVCEWMLGGVSVEDAILLEEGQPLVRGVGRDGEIFACHIVQNSNAVEGKDE